MEIETTFVLAAVALVAFGALLFWRRAIFPRKTADIPASVQDLASTTDRRAGDHAADRIEDPRLAVAGLAAAIAQIDRPWSAKTEAQLNSACQQVFGLPHEDAVETAAFAKWLSDRADTYPEMVDRLSIRLMQISSERTRIDLSAFLRAMFSDKSGKLSPVAEDALQSVGRVLE
ncbi:MAG: hypothetical protein AAGO57_02270 [Pseudomonadota bacterium]